MHQAFNTITEKKSASADKAQPWVAFAISMAIGLLLHGYKFFLGPTAPVRLHDTVDSEYPRFQALGDALQQFGAIEWLPLMAGGAPVNAFHYSLAHPLIWLNMIVPGWAIQTGLMTILVGLSGYGLYRLASELFDIGHRASLIASVVFTLVTAHHFAGLAFNPWIFLLPLFVVWLHGPVSEDYGPLNRIGRALALMVFMAFSYPILGLAKFTIAHGVILCAFWIWQRKIDWRMVATGVVFWAGYALIFMPSFMGLLDYLPYVHRDYPAADFSSFGDIAFYTALIFPLKAVVGLIVLHYHHLPLVMAALFAFPHDRRSAALVAAYVFVWLLSAFLLSDLYKLFGDNMIRKMDLYYLRWAMPALSCLMMASVLDNLENQTTTTRRRVLAGLMITGFVMVSATIALSGISNYSFWTLMMAGLTSIIALSLSLLLLPHIIGRDANLAERLRKPALMGLILGSLGVIFVIAPLRVEPESWTTITGPYNQLEELKAESSQSPFRVAMIGAFPPVAQMQGLETFGGVGPLFNTAWKDFARLVVDPQIRQEAESSRTDEVGPKTKGWEWWYYLTIADWQERPRTRAFLANPPDRHADDWNLTPLALANVRYLVSTTKIEGLVAPLPRQSQDRFFIYPVPAAKARVYSPEAIAVFDDEKTILNALAASTGDMALTRGLVLAKDRPDGFQNDQAQCNDVRLQSYQPDRIDVVIEADHSCMVIIANNFHHHWRAQLGDGPALPVIRANHAMQGVFIPKTDETLLTIEFDDPLFPGILVLILPGLALIGLAGFYGGRARRFGD